MTTNPEPLSDDELAAIEARANAATEGPWQAGNQGFPDAVEEVAFWERTSTVEGHPVCERWTLCEMNGDPVDTRGRVCYDAEFIAHARTDIPALVAEVQRLRAFECAQCQARPAVTTLTVGGLPACDRCWWLNMGIEPGMLPPLNLPRSDGSGDQTIYIFPAEAQDA